MDEQDSLSIIRAPFAHIQTEPTTAHHFVNLHFLSPTADGREPEALICCCFRAHRTGDSRTQQIVRRPKTLLRSQSLVDTYAGRARVRRLWQGPAPLLRMN